MRNALPQCARLLAMATFAAACSPKSGPPPAHRQASVTIKVTCGPTITVSVDPSTVRFTHPGNGVGSMDVQWNLDQSSSIDNVTFAPDAPPNWPFAPGGGPPYNVGKNTPFKAIGNLTQGLGPHRYSVAVSCPGAPTVIFDPDIWVD